MCVCVCRCVHVHVCACACICMYVYVYVRAHVCVSVYIYVCVCVCLWRCVHVHACARVCMCTCGQVCICEWMCVCLCEATPRDRTALVRSDCSAPLTLFDITYFINYGQIKKYFEKTTSLRSSYISQQSKYEISSWLIALPRRYTHVHGRTDRQSINF